MNEYEHITIQSARQIRYAQRSSNIENSNISYWIAECIYKKCLPKGMKKGEYVFKIIGKTDVTGYIRYVERNRDEFIPKKK